MSVYTQVTAPQAEAWLKRYSIGTLVKLEGISSGIENTNYFLTTSHGEFVLTLFEKLAAQELPYYINLMAHLANHGIPCPKPIAKLDDAFLGELNGKPACIVSRLAGRSLSEPAPAHCAEVGATLADMHLAGQSYKTIMPNAHGPKWWKSFSAQLLPLVPADEANIITEELRFQSLYRLEDIPRGVIHADLFRDNILFVDSRVGGVIDFYFACNDALLYDLAITANDWCVRPDATLDEARVLALLKAYHATRPLTAIEHGAWPAMLRAAAFRSWLGRLGYNYFPMAGEITHTKDHSHFKRILQNHTANQPALRELWV